MYFHIFNKKIHVFFPVELKNVLMSSPVFRMFAIKIYK